MNGCWLSHSDSRRWAVILVVVTSISVTAMPAWRWMWIPLPVPEMYQITAKAFLTNADAMIVAYATGEHVEKIPVIHPPPGDIYLVVQRFSFTPVLELESSSTYRLHVAAIDCVHSVINVPPAINTNYLLIPGYATVIHLTSLPTGSRYVVQCNEYCGLGHNYMRGWILVQ